jgi:50S ribosomal subunit-associated GTPase HflX
VADVTRPETVENLSQHIQLFLSVNPKGWIVIALNKADLLEENKVAKLLQLNQFSEQSQVIAVYPSSAKTGQHVDEIFSKLASQMTI